jgi:hypothetical protein
MRARRYVLIGSIAVSVAALAGCGTRPAASSGGGSAAGSSAGAAAAQSSGLPGASAAATGSAGTATAPPAQVVTVPPAGTPSTPPPRIVIGENSRVTLTEADNGAAVILRPGQTISVVLGGQSFISWHTPRAAGATLRRISSSGGYPGNKPAQASFRAVRPGRTWISSVTDAACLHTQPACQIPQRLWQVTVIVRARGAGQ